MERAARISSLQAKLRRKKLDAMLISEPHNRRYLSGYSAQDHDIGESSGSLLVPARKAPILLTDFRFQLQAEEEVGEMEVLLYPKGMLTLLQTLLPSLGIQSLGFEPHYTLHSVKKKMEETLIKSGVSLTPLTDVIEEMRLIKDAGEIEKIRQSVLLNEAVFEEIYTDIRSFQTEIELSVAIETLMRQKGAEAPSFATIVASGRHSALPHCVPNQTKIKKNKPLMIDMGLVLDGYCSDMTRSFVPKKASTKYKTIHRLVRNAQQSAMAAIRAGVSGASIDKIARTIISDGGYGKQFGHALGHGVGLAVHEGPRLSTKNRKLLRAGMVITVEPGIYLPDWGGVRLENMVVVQEEGCELLNQNSTWLDI